MKRFLSKYKKYLAACIALLLLVGAFGLAGSPEGEESPNVKAALLYNGKGGSRQYLDTYSQLQQSFLANFEIEKIDVGRPFLNLSKYDLVYLDPSVAALPNLKGKIVEFVENGGSLFVTNDFAAYFDLDFFGAKELVKVEAVPIGLVCGEVANDLVGIQEIIKDFSKVYEKYRDRSYLAELDYGYGFVPDTAVSLADFDGVSIYGINSYGEGTVFYTNPLLPNSFHINGFSLEKTNDVQQHFTHSTATGNQLILSEFASYVSKMKNGYSVKRVLGSFGNPTMAWQLHYEEISAFQNGSAKIFGEMCREYNTIPSFTLIRNTYKWFSKYESVTYLLGDKGLYHMDLRENAYSSGTHVVEADGYLALAEVENTGSYFLDNHSFMQTAYPYIADLDGDGWADMICGSSDGRFYYFAGEAFAGQWQVKDRQVLRDLSGSDLQVGAYSAPSLYDYDRDGVLDIISGDGDGNVVFFKGAGDMRFDTGRVIMPAAEAQRSLPFAYDLNGDGVMDLAVGSLAGTVRIYEGNKDGGFAQVGAVECPEESFLAPFIYDYDGDGAADLICGTFDGYVRKFKNAGGYSYVEDGYYGTEEMNYKGTHRIKFGNNCVPRFYDINGDGEADLVAGELEYGLAVPIDSPYFKYRDELQDQIDYMKDNHYYLGVHFYTSEYSSAEREAEELRLHKQAFAAYGIDCEDIGGNMHTWRVSEFSPYQTLTSAKEAGLRWISCFRAAKSSATPDTSSEFALISPFFTDFAKKDFMVANPSVLGYTYDAFAYMSAKYDLPISEYYHCDFVYRNEQTGRKKIEQLVAYQRANNYNFVREDQLIKGAAAAYNMALVIEPGEDGIVLSAKEQSKDFKLYDRAYQSCTGVKIEFADRIDVDRVGVKAQVWRYAADKRALYLGLGSEVGLDFDCAGEAGEYKPIAADSGHILTVNIPAAIEIADNRAAVSFADDGMLQVFVAGEVRNCSDGWSCEYADGVTAITKFGAAADLTFEFAD